MCTTYPNHVPSQDKGHTWRLNIKWEPIVRQFRVYSINFVSLKDFLQRWLKCSLEQGNVQNPCNSFSGLISLCSLTLEDQLSEKIISPLYFLYPLKDSLQSWPKFSPKSWYAEPILLLCRLMLKVTFEGQFSANLFPLYYIFLEVVSSNLAYHMSDILIEIISIQLRDRL